MCHLFLSPMSVKADTVPTVTVLQQQKIGNAVCRNRARRVIRAAYYELSPALRDGSFDIVFVARTKTAAAKSTDVKKAMTGHLKQAGLL